MNWDLIIVAVIAASPGFCMAALAWHQARETHLAVNSRMSELLELTRKAAGDSATLSEKAAQRAREGVAATAIIAKEEKEA